MSKGYVSIPVGYKRVDNQPLELNTLFENLASAIDYARNNPTAYIGQLISVIKNSKAYVYVITQNMNLSLLKTASIEYVPENSPYTVNHNRDEYPGVRCINSEGNLIESSVKYLDRNNLIVEWNGTFSGIIVVE